LSSLVPAAKLTIKTWLGFLTLTREVSTLLYLEKCVLDCAQNVVENRKNIANQDNSIE